MPEVFPPHSVSSRKDKSSGIIVSSELLQKSSGKVLVSLLYKVYAVVGQRRTVPAVQSLASGYTSGADH